MTAQPALPYHCPVLRIDFLQRPCEKNLKRAAEFLKKNWHHMGGLEQCQECRGARLEVKDLEASKEFNAFCPAHPEQRLEVVKKQKNGASILTTCALCETAAKAPAAPEVRYCKHHPDTPDHKNTGLCLNCLGERAAANSRNRKGRKTSTGETPVPPDNNWVPVCKNHLRQAKYAELKVWLEEQAKENERTLNQEIMYRLKLAMREAEKT